MRRLDPRSAGVQALIVVLVLVAKAFLTRSLTLGDGRVAQSLMLEGPLLATLVLLTVVVARQHRGLALIMLDAALSCVMFATAVYAAYYDQVLTPALLGLAGQAADTMDSIVGLLRQVHLLYALDVPFLIAGTVLLDRSVQLQPARALGESVRRRRFGAASITLVLLAGAVASGVLIAGAWRLPSDVNTIAAARRWGLLSYQAAAVKGLVVTPEPPGALDPQQAAHTAAEVERARGSQTTERLATFAAGEFAGKNLIVIQVEALQSGLIDGTLEGERLVPNLSAFAEMSWYFPRAYSQISRGNTSDAEFVFNTALYPPPQEAASVRWGDRAIPSLPRLLKELGYHSVTFHANEAAFWNRANLYTALGFDRYYDRVDIGWTPKWHWGSSDEVVFDKGLATLLELRKRGDPLYAQFVTMTSHHPFNYPPPEDRPYQPPADLKETLMGDYLSSMSYTDAAVGEFLEDLKRTGLWDDSVIVIYGDHFGVRRPEADAESERLSELFGGGYNIVDVLQVPFIVHLPGQTEGHIIDATVGQVDMLPTLADPLGISLDGMPHFGRNAFTTSRALLGQRGVAAAGSMLNDRVIVQPGLSFDDARAWDLVTGREVSPASEDRDDFETITRLMRVSLEYTDALPVREGADSSDIGIIPNE
jgi:phosphoglycerol transferase MdoB-like AlkP superfamily enzyme